MNSYAPPLQGTADSLAKHGRYGDSMLVHMNPIEVQGIAALSPTGRLTTNPVTGQQEAFLPFLAPLVGGWLGSAALTGAGAGILGGAASAGLSSAMAGAIGSGLASWAESGDIQQGLMSGLTGYGLGSALGAAKLGGKAAAEGARQAALDPGLWGPTQGIIQSGAASSGDLIPSLMKNAPLIAAGEMGRSELQAQRELEGLSDDDSERDEEILRQQYGILGGAWDQLAKDYPYPVQPYPRYAGGGQVQRFQAGGMLESGEFPTLGPESAAARQASIRGSVFVPPPTVNEAGQPWRAGFDPEHNYFGSPVNVPEPPDIRLPHPWEPQGQPSQETTGMYTPTTDPTGTYGGFTHDSPMPRRGDYDEMSGMEFRNDYQDWLGSQGASVPAVAGAASGIMQPTERIAQPVMEPQIPPPPAPQVDSRPDRSDYGEEEGMDYKRDLRDWNASQDQPAVAPPIPEPPVMQPPVPPQVGQRPVRGDYGEEEGSDYRDDLRDWRESQAQPAVVPPPPVMQPPPPMPPPVMPPTRIVDTIPTNMPYQIDDIGNINVREPQPLPPPPPVMPPINQTPPPTPQVVAPPLPITGDPYPAQSTVAPPIPPPVMEPTPVAPVGQRPKRSDYGEEERADFRRDLLEWKEGQNQPPPGAGITDIIPTPQMPMPPPPPQAMVPPPPPPMPPPQAMPPMPPPPAPAPVMAPPPPPPMMQPPAPQPVMQPQPLPPAPPPPQAVAPPPQDRGPRPKRSDYGDEERADYRRDLREWKAAQGYQEGGIVDLAANNQAMMAEQPIDPAMQQEAQMADQLVQQTILAILGRVDDPDVIIDMFIDEFGQEAYLALRDEVLNSVVPGANTEGLIDGPGDGMSDNVPGMIGDQQRVATSQGEYIIPADAVSGLGNGSTDAGAGALDGMVAGIREARTGTDIQPEAIIPEEFMPA